MTSLAKDERFDHQFKGDYGLVCSSVTFLSDTKGVTLVTP